MCRRTSVDEDFGNGRRVVRHIIKQGMQICQNWCGYTFIGGHVSSRDRLGGCEQENKRQTLPDQSYSGLLKGRAIGPVGDLKPNVTAS
ncbi:hypothetical protein L484_002229 [Morus notabilis]|uniref:Uncharacterized protein n=1 Tax=Morus notabilis TaxID=981085 RepID=W9S1R6_9ROSA|nr:hypothetical protein L484_002229 [Morus notabilis]